MGPFRLMPTQKKNEEKGEKTPQMDIVCIS